MRITSIFLIPVSCLLILSCTKEKQGVVDTASNAPSLLTASIQPDSVHLDADTLNVVSLGNGSFRITAAVLARAVDRDGANDIGTLSYAVYPPRSTSPLATGTLLQSLSSVDTSTYSASIVFTTKRTDAGLHTVEFFVRDNSHLVSNVLRRSLNVERNNSRPEIFGLLAPDTLYRPAVGTRLFRMAMTASDSDGVGDIAEVYFRSINSSNPNQHIQLFDDGNLITSGDSVAGDGRYARILTFSSTDSTGRREFRFWARDNAGALSDSIIHFVTIVPE